MPLIKRQKSRLIALGSEFQQLTIVRQIPLSTGISAGTRKVPNFLRDTIFNCYL